MLGVLALYSAWVQAQQEPVDGEDLLGLRFRTSHGMGIRLTDDNRRATFIGTPSTGSDGRGAVALIGSPMCNGGSKDVFTLALRMSFSSKAVPTEAGVAGRNSAVAAVLDSGTRVSRTELSSHTVCVRVTI